jgi:NAD(P)-dependent dehydrogenase (short-subunit alcohol dehydrogenase family)
MNSLKNKVAIITGSEGDIGKALVKKFEEVDYKVYKFDIKRNQDISDYVTMSSDIREIYKYCGKIDVLINNAGITIGGYEENAWDRTLEINLKAPFMLSKIVQPYMINGGSIINITSLWSELGGENNPAYGASKGGLKQLTKCLAYDYAKYNIRVNNVGFGYIKTDMTKFSQINRKEEIEKRTMLNRFGEPKDVVGLIAFLCSNEASYITGEDYYVTGGMLNKLL